MPNKNYLKGRRKEYSLCKEFREKGFEVAQRSAGSHSPIDVFAISKKLKKIIFLQAKPSSMPEKQRKEIEKELKWLNGKFEVEFKVV